MTFTTNPEAFKFESVIGTVTQIEVLYELLKTRIHSISHKSIPTFEQHTKFVKNKTRI